MHAARRTPIFFFASLFFGLTFSFCFVSPASALTRITSDITTPTTWTKENGPYIVQTHAFVRAPLTIEAGTIVKFSGSLSALAIKDNFIVNGTRAEPVFFTSNNDDSAGGDTNGNQTLPRTGDWSGLNFNPANDKKLDVRYAKVRYSSFGISIYSSAFFKNRTVKNCEFKNNGYGIVTNNAEPLVENNVITQNLTGVKDYASIRSAKITNNAIFQNIVGAEASGGSLDARNNWWGGEAGPNQSNTDKTTGNVLFDPWIRENPLETPDPAILIPGIMGSWEKDGTWQIDPIFHIYDDLEKSFEGQGYQKYTNLFPFPYEWRNSNAENAKLLHKKIQEIKRQTKRPKVDLVAHSMGGLLAREYIESDYYEGDVDQLITVGTPHLGAAKDYVKWEAGAFFADIFELAGKKFFEQEAEENGYDSIFHYIRGRPIASVQELLPVYDYLWDDNGSGYDLRTGYPVNYPRNEFLENLNRAEKVKKLGNVEFVKIVGRPAGQKTTLVGYNVVNVDMGEFWKHGYPHSFEIPRLTDQGLRKGEGDRTVPLVSAESINIPSNNTIYLQSSHNDLPTDAQQDILELLTGKRPTEKIDEWQIDDILATFIFSPIDVQIISPSGKRLGKNFETGGEYSEIEGAYYTGHNTNTEFLVIPNPEDGEYKILTQGTGNGDYTIKISKISENEEESTETLTGNTEKGKQEEAIVSIKDGKVEKLIIETEENEETTNDENNTNPNIPQKITVTQSNLQKLDSLKGKTRHFFKNNQIKTRKEAKDITKKLNNLRLHLKRYETEYIPRKQKILKEKINKRIIRLIARINQDYPKKIDEEARNHIIAILEELEME
jgi:pimeloyl-ACP methyl ester carboxylesterase